MSDPRAIDVTSGAPDVVRIDLGRFRVSDAVFPRGYSIPRHHHDRACISVVVAGRFLQRFPGKDCDCPPGGVIAKPPGETHEDRWFDAASHHVIVEPDPLQHEALGPCAPLADTIVHHVDPGAGISAERIAAELRHREPAFELAVEALVLDLLVRIHRGPPGPTSGRKPPSWLLRVRDLLHERFRERLRLDELAAEAGVHPTHLSRVFNSWFPGGLASYVRALRLAEARRELALTDDPVSRIAYRNGFSDQSHLTRALRADTGLTPGRYRQIHRRG